MYRVFAHQQKKQKTAVKKTAGPGWWAGGLFSLLAHLGEVHDGEVKVIVKHRGVRGHIDARVGCVANNLKKQKKKRSGRIRSYALQGNGVRIMTCARTVTFQPMPTASLTIHSMQTSGPSPNPYLQSLTRTSHFTAMKCRNRHRMSVGFWAFEAGLM